MLKNRLKILRAEKDITQQELSQMIGVSRQTINSIEKNKYVPSTALALKLSEIFKVTVNEIFQLNDEETAQ